MGRWARGEAVVEQLIRDGELQSVGGAAAEGEPWLAKARRTLVTAGGITDTDPESAFVLAYDAARLACTALLAQQGLRPTSKGGHLVVDQVVRTQFGDTFRPFRALRIRRNELEYPAYPGDLAETPEALAAVADTEAILDAVEKLLPHLGLF